MIVSSVEMFLTETTSSEIVSTFSGESVAVSNVIPASEPVVNNEYKIASFETSFFGLKFSASASTKPATSQLSESPNLANSSMLSGFSKIENEAGVKQDAAIAENVQNTSIKEDNVSASSWNAGFSGLFATRTPTIGKKLDSVNVDASNSLSGGMFDSIKRRFSVTSKSSPDSPCPQNNDDISSPVIRATDVLFPIEDANNVLEKTEIVLELKHDSDVPANEAFLGILVQENYVSAVNAEECDLAHENHYLIEPVLVTYSADGRVRATSLVCIVSEDKAETTLISDITKSIEA